MGTLIRLSAANAIAIVVQIFNSLFDALVAGRLGTVPLESVSFVVPVVLLMHGVAATGYGGGLSSAIARSLGEGDRHKVEAVAGNGLVLGVVTGTVWGALMLMLTPTIYRRMGASTDVLDVALSYSNIVFALAPVSWLFYGLVSVLRGAGNMAVSAVIVVLGSAWYAGLSLAFVFVPGSPFHHSLRGVATAFVLYHCVGVLIVLYYLRSRRIAVVLSRRSFMIRGEALTDILHVGFASALNSVQAQLLAVVIVASVGTVNPRAAAGYGIGWRLEQIHVALAFGVGLALVAMVGANVGAGNSARARRIAWAGATLTATVTGMLGVSMAAAPRLWVSLFTSDVDVVEYASRYLSIVGATHGFFGLGLALYYASQGAGRVTVPLIAGTLRLAIAGLGCWSIVHGNVNDLDRGFIYVAASFLAYGVVVGLWSARRTWPGLAAGYMTHPSRR